jgi:O-antigen/teichoic acid export membrane protein
LLGLARWHRTRSRKLAQGGRRFSEIMRNPTAGRAGIQVALTESQLSDRLARLPLVGSSAHLRTWLNDSSDRSIAQKVASAAFFIRVFSAALIYLSQILFARWMGSFEFGIYVYVWTWVMLVGDLCDLGLATAAQRFVPEYAARGALEYLRGFISRSRWLAVGSATTIAALAALLVKLMEPWLASYVVLPLMIACVTLPFYSLMQIQDGIARSQNWIHLALLPPYVVRHLVMLLLVSAAYLLNFPTTAETVVMAVAASFAVTVLGQTIVLNRRLARSVAPGPKAYEAKTWFAVSLPILMVEGFYLLLSNTAILVLQQFRPPDDVAVFYGAAKTLTLIAFVHFAVSAAVAHRFSEYRVTADHARLKEFLADSIRWTFWASLVSTVVILGAGRFLLSLFGERFVEGYHLMFILAVGLMARAAIGPVERLLNMLGEQRACAFAYASAFVLNLLLCVALIPHLGVDGAAIGTTTAMIVESVLLFWVTRRRLGLHVFIWGGR